MIMATTAAKKTAANPEANAAPIESPPPVVDPGCVKIDAGHFNRRVMVHLPEGAVPDDVRDPRIWRKVQVNKITSLLKYDELTIYTHDEGSCIRAIVAHATGNEACISVEKIFTFRQIKTGLFNDGVHKVDWIGHAYVVKRVADGVLVDPSGYGTEGAAIAALHRLYPTKAA
jgi:hypothetical protein